MHKKKISALVVAGLLTVGVIGGTLAWFTSSDSVTNIFNTGTSGDITNPNAGIEIEENFKDPDGNKIEKDPNGNAEYTKPVLPGDEFTKEVKVNSTANYNQFVRAKITKVWKLAVEQKSATGVEAISAGTVIKSYKEVDGKVIYSTTEEGRDWTLLNDAKIQLTLSEPGTIKGDTWTSLQSDGYYYYNQILEEKASTCDLLEKVTFVSDANDNCYKNLTFEVKVEAEGVQATNGAAQDSQWSTDVPVAEISGYKIKQSK